MLNKNSLRKKFLILRKKRYFEIKPEFFNPIINLITKKKKEKLFIYQVITLLILKLMSLKYLN